ncbi:MAG TPA: hypothetical protein VH025_07360 [Solirubrobacteraceae bacterium]|jgi:hypothetical protein|nr:hypothetical protein [Solirubrobacteraceae bacterium]
MTLGSSIFVVAVGAILRYAVTAHTSGVSIHTIGLILMIAGVVGAVLSLFYMLLWTGRRPANGAVVQEYREPPAL